MGSLPADGNRAASIAPTSPPKPFLICFAGDRWDGNPHSRHHLMRRFAGEFEVLFVESLPMRSLSGVGRTEIRRAARKLAAGSRLMTAAPHLHVLRPPPIPPAGRVGRTAQLLTVRAQIGLARQRLRAAGPVVSWFSVPTAAPLRGAFGETGSIFYYQDRYDEFSHVDAPLLRAQISELARCDVCIAPSDELARDLRELGAQPVVVPHGVDVERFAGDPAAPAELAELERPLIGHVGLLDDHLSFSCIRETAARLERGTVVLLGGANTDVSELRHPRIVQLGFRPYEQMPAYLNAFACCLVPFKVNRLTLAVNPIKLREYLAAGRPVVSTPLPSVARYRDVVALAREPGEFADAVLRLLAPEADTLEARRRRRAAVSGESWDAVAERIRPLLRDLARGSSGPIRSHSSARA